MTLSERRSYFEAIRKRYMKAPRHLKKSILDEYCAICGYNRKYAIRQLNRRPLRNKAKRPGPKRYYEPERLLEPLRLIWLATEQVCSKKLKALLPIWLPFYEKDYTPLSDEVRDKLLSVSARTLDRLLKPARVSMGHHGKSGTKPGTLLKQQIPIKVDNWDVTKPGFVEADTVAHCGTSLQGDFAWSITLTDIVTTWTSNAAIWNKGASGLIEQMQVMEKRLPFKLLGFDSDNGSEFLNHHLWRYFAKRKRPVQFTRSRPYHKNDNAHVEQKNWTHLRQLLGYERIEKKTAVAMMNDLYMTWELYQNYFIPTTKLIAKEKIKSKYRKRYDEPKTPYERVLACDSIAQSAKLRHVKYFVSESYRENYLDCLVNNQIAWQKVA